VTSRIPALALLLAASCAYREPVPPSWSKDARFGRLAGYDPPPAKNVLCKHWSDTIIARDRSAATHQSFPETNARAACFTRVTHEGRDVRAGPTPSGCEYPDAAARRRLLALADALSARADASALFPCELSAWQREMTIRHNVRALRALANAAGDYPYSAVVLPGHGLAAQDALGELAPDSACAPFDDLPRFGAMPARSAVGADALRGGVAPVAIASGGAVHSRVVEAFAMMHLLVCREGIAPERVILEPCADHTHTNLRNSARWVAAMGGRAAYLLTDDGLQSRYFQDWSGFELILGSVDQRSLRDWGYVIGSWRQASAGTAQGFWFTPYRFWAEPKDGLGSVTCADYQSPLAPPPPEEPPPKSPPPPE
jgi:hypothetical protein